MACERVTLGETDSATERQHLARYQWALTFAKNRDVLDCACGTGYGTKMLMAAGAKSAVGVDASEEAISFAQTSYTASGISFRVDDAQALHSVPSESKDLVVSFETIEHVPNDSAFLAAVRRVLRPGGEFLVSTPDFRLGGFRQRLTGRLANPFHLREYTFAELMTLLSKDFVLKDCCGQMPVAMPWTVPPVEVAIKTIGYRVIPWLLKHAVHETYHSHHADVVPITNPRWYVPNFWVLRLQRI